MTIEAVVRKMYQRTWQMARNVKIKKLHEKSHKNAQNGFGSWGKDLLCRGAAVSHEDRDLMCIGNVSHLQGNKSN